MNRIVLAYSGDVDSSLAIPWLAERHRADVVTVTMDVGQRRELTGVRERALALGAVRAHVLDVRDEFATAFVLPALQAGALDADDIPIAGLAHAVVARRLLEIARIEGARSVAHASARPDDDGPAPIDRLLRALDRDIAVVTPARDWGLRDSDKAAMARSHGMPLAAVGDPAHGTSLLGRIVRDEQDDDSSPTPPALFTLTRPPIDAPGEPAGVELSFERGVPVRINGAAMSLVEMIQSLETIAGAHGVGRWIQPVRSPDGTRRCGIRDIVEAPAVAVLRTAHRTLRSLVTPADLDRLSAELAPRYGDLIQRGAWYSPLRESLDAFVATVQARVTGTVRLTVFKGACRVHSFEVP
jgi:argininosuccinate synthase